MRISLLALILLLPTTLAAEPQGGPPEPWILMGSATVTSSVPSPTPCVEPSAATIYTWVQSWSANFQLSLEGGCDTMATVFYGTGDIWSGFDLDAFVGTIASEGRVGSFFDGDTVPLDLTQTLPDGRVVHIVGDFTIVF